MVFFTGRSLGCYRIQDTTVTVTVTVVSSGTRVPMPILKGSTLAWQCDRSQRCGRSQFSNTTKIQGTWLLCEYERSDNEVRISRWQYQLSWLKYHGRIANDSTVYFRKQPRVQQLVTLSILCRIRHPHNTDGNVLLFVSAGWPIKCQ